MLKAWLLHLLFVSASFAAVSASCVRLRSLLKIFNSSPSIMYYTLLSRTLTSVSSVTPLNLFSLVSLCLFSVLSSFTWWCRLEVTAIFSQGRPGPRSGVLMPGWLSDTDSPVPVGDRQGFSDCGGHRSPWWIGPDRPRPFFEALCRCLQCAWWRGVKGAGVKKSWERGME